MTSNGFIGLLSFETHIPSSSLVINSDEKKIYNVPTISL